MRATVLTVLIPTHGRPTLLGRTLGSLGACRLPAGYAEAVVVENGSRAGAEAVVAEAAAAHPHLRLRYMHVARANKSHALNEALATVGEGLVVFFDDDVRLEPGVLAAYAEAAAAHPARAFFGGPLLCDYEEEPPAWMIPHLPRSATGMSLAEAVQDGYFLGANWAAFRGGIMGVGGFSDAYGPGSTTGAGGQETYVQRLLCKAGNVQIPVAGASVWHHVPRARCEPQWLLKRMHTQGISSGLLGFDEDGPHRLYNGLRRTKRYVTRLIRGFGALALARLRRRDDLAWEARFGVAVSLGFFRGYFYLPHVTRPGSEANGGLLASRA